LTASKPAATVPGVRFPGQTLSISVILVFFATVFLTVSCSRDSELIPREDLFSLSLGKMEHEIDLFQLDGYRGNQKNRLFMRGGIFYLVNGNASKILETTSFGDVLALYYNTMVNPKPIVLSQSNDGHRRNRVAIPYDFLSPGEIAVLRDGRVIVEDRAPEARRYFDRQFGQILDRVLLRFSADRKFVDYIGQEGPGGAPFPVILGIYPTVSDQLVVVCRTADSFLVYWYDDRGKRRFLVRIDESSIPVPDLGSWTSSIQKVIPDPEFDQLFVHIDYYPNDRQKNNRIESRIYQISLASGTWDRFLSLPEATMANETSSGPESGDMQSLFSFQGIAVGGNFFFLARRSLDRYQLVVLDRSGRVIHRRMLEIPDSKASEIDFNLNFSGILSAFLVYQDHGGVSWWRTDKLLGPGDLNAQ